MGVVPAEVRLFERLSGEELLEYSGRLRGLPAAEARSRAAQLLDVLDLTEDANRLVADYSTGMRKKAALGCALIHNPSMLFLDEPLEGVDPVSADVIRRLLTRFVASGSTVLFSSHVMELVEQVCDHVSIIDKGKIVVSGTTDQVRGGKTLQRAFIDLVGPRATRQGGAVMARLLVQLKLRLLLNALRSSRAAKISFIISTIFAVLLAVGTFLVLASFRGKSTSVDLTAVIFTVFAFGWLIAPIMVFGVDSTLDPSTLALYPLRTRKLATGLLAASSTGAWPLGQRDRPARRHRRTGQRRARPDRRGDRGGVAGAVLHRPIPVRDDLPGQPAALASRPGPRRVHDHPAVRAVRVLHPGGAQGRRRGQDHRGELHRLRLMDALAAARPGRARDPGCIGRASRHGVRPPGGAGRRHRRIRLAVGQVAEPGSGDRRHDDPGSAGPRRQAAAGRPRPARRRCRAVLALPAPRPDRHSSTGRWSR